MNGLDLYNKVRQVPSTALKEIQAGRLKGKSDINPMWRIKSLTEEFGVCGIGWKYAITNQWLERGANDEISAFVNINLYIKDGDKWSDAIPGTGGSAFVAKESKGLYTSDECYKMALTDAISVACKALGFGADIYWGKDETKYSKTHEEGSQSTEPTSNNDTPTLSEKQIARAVAIGKAHGINLAAIKKQIAKDYKVTEIAQLNKARYDELCARLEKAKPEKSKEKNSRSVSCYGSDNCDSAFESMLDDAY